MSDVRWNIDGSRFMIMTQNEKWLVRYQEVKSFMETNHRNPSKHRIEEHAYVEI